MGVYTNRSQFSALAGELSGDLYRYAFWLCRDPDIAEDLVQETLLRAWRARSSLKEQDKAKQWLLTILRRENARRFDRQQPDLVDVDEAFALASPDGVGDTVLDDMRRAILDLDEGYREPLVLQVLLGHTTAEIAEIMDMSQGAVLTRLFRARKQLQGVMGADAGSLRQIGEKG